MDVPPDTNKGSQILVSCSVCVGVALMAVVARVGVRLKVLRNFGWDDYFIVAAMALLLAEFVCVVLSVMYGAGRHVQYIDEEDFVTGLHYNFATQPLSITSLCLAKVSVGLLLLRLTTTKWHIRMIWGITTFTVLAWLANFFTGLFQCIPMQKIWDFATPGRCIPASNLLLASYFNSAVSGMTDLLFALMPIPLLWKVQMNRRTKAAVIAILSLGGFVTVSAILKMVYLGSFGQYGDFLFDSTEITIWANVEIGTAIVAACAPTLRPLFQSILRSGTTSKYNRGYVDRTSRDEPRAYGQSNKDRISGVQLGILSRVTGGDPSRTESQERFVHTDEERFISKTVSVSVN